EMPRTRSEEHEEINVPVRFADGQEADLRIPDLSGEYLQSIVERRTLSPERCQALDDASGLLLYVHPNRTIWPWRLAVVGAPDVEDEAGTTEFEDALGAAGVEDETVATDGEAAPAPASAEHSIPLQG